MIQKCQIWNENKNLYLKNETHTCTKIRENDALKRKDSTEATSENFLASYLILKCKDHLMLQIIITCILVIEKTYNIGNILLMEVSLSEATTFWIFCDSKLTIVINSVSLFTARYIKHSHTSLMEPFLRQYLTL